MFAQKNEQYELNGSNSLDRMIVPVSIIQVFLYLKAMWQVCTSRFTQL